MTRTFFYHYGSVKLHLYKDCRYLSKSNERTAGEGFEGSLYQITLEEATADVCKACQKRAKEGN